MRADSMITHKPLLNSSPIMFPFHILLWLAMLILMTACQGIATSMSGNPSSQPETTVPASATTPPLSPATQTLLPSASPTREITFFPTMTATISTTTTLAPGTRRTVSEDGMLQVYVPAGWFDMGSLPEDPGADADEYPLHEVYLDAFWIDQVEVTNAMFARFLNQMGNQVEERASWLDAGDEDVQIYQAEGEWQVKKGYETHPVVEVNWFGAQAYCRWAGRQLPSEAQWERAARGSDRRTFPPGEKINCSHANTIECKRNSAEPADARPDGASPFNAFDMAGNLWEWVADWYDTNFYTESPAENPSGPLDGQFKVLRGGSYGQDRMHARSANRRHNAPANSQFDYGFRCASPGE
jgi:eukaryotic-like serine/threonine-protein kinase